MIEKLKSRSLVDKVFVSQSSLVNYPFSKQDMNDDDFEGADDSTIGNMQYMLKMNLN